MCVAAYRRQRTHQVDMDVGETTRRHADVLIMQAHMSGHLSPLAVQAARSPGTDVFVHARLQKPGRYQMAGAPDIRVRNRVKCIKGPVAELRRKKWSVAMPPL